MVKYNFKSIQVVPKAQEFIDIVLTKTQRKTPTVVHPGYAISKIRQFYLRKIKFTQQLIHDKLTKILTDFPLLDEIHPFYEDLMNVLYDRDHYKLALGQLNTARRLVDTIGRDYLKLMKFGDSLYRCKQLKRAALGRMVKVLRKNGTSFAYLEEVRQHLARLPSIDPNTRTLLVTGYPNVGKSSFMNKITRANVEVQPYAFTTKSLYVGHTDYRFLTWQVIDTPGILDGPLEERNTKEMQSITALAHLKAAILYFIDISEQCGYSIEQQVKLYKSMERLFEGKPIVVVLNKIDVKKPEDLDENQKALIQSIKGDNIEMVPMSNLSEEGISNVKQIACDKIMQQRTETILSSHKNEDILSRVHVAMPVARDDKERPVHVPEVDKEKHNETARRREEEWRLQQRLYKELDPEYKGINWKEDYIVDDPEWKKDRIPEIMDGKNVFDYWSGDVDEKLQEVELEEVARLRSLEELLREDDISQYKLTPEQQEKVRRIREKRKLLIKDSRLRRGVDKPKIPKKYNTKNLTVTDLEAHLESLGMDSSAVAERLRSESRNRSESRGRIRDRISMTREERELSKTPLPGEGYSDLKHKLHAERLARRAMKRLTQDGRMGESDRHQFDWMPKHLFAGKMGAGTKDRR